MLTFFQLAPLLIRIWDNQHEISMGYSTNPNLGHSHFSRNFQSLYEYVVYYRGEDFCAQEMVTYVLQSCRLLSSEWLSCFEDVVQSFLNASLLGVCFLQPRQTTYHLNIGAKMRKMTLQGLSAFNKVWWCYLVCFSWSLTSID